VRLESNKRHGTLAPATSTTYVTDGRLGTGTSLSSTRAWDTSASTFGHVTRGLYKWNATTPYTTMRAVLPPAPPKASFVRYTNPLAYDLKSLRSTRFYTSVDKPNVWAELSVKCPTGTKYLYKGAIPNAGENFYFLPWDGMGPDGKRMTSAAYEWTLRLSQSGSTSTYTGKITVSRICFSISGTAKAGSPVRTSAYMVPGSANCYIAATSGAASDALYLSLAGPNGFAVAQRNFGVSSGAPLNAVSYYRDAAAIRSAGTHAWTFTGRVAPTYRVTVIQ
jgi:hypothetical protein